jgi:SAM-dependent methyltransferase
MVKVEIVHRTRARRAVQPLFIWALGALCGALWSVTPAQAQEPTRAERHRVPADFMSFQGAPWLERDERVEEEQPDAVLDAMALQAGDVVADIGCGSGYYARRMARRVGDTGRVYCVDIQPEMLEIMAEHAAGEGITGIVPVLSEPDDPKLPEGEVDWLILADVYHEMSDFEAMLAGMRQSLAPGGQVALLEYRVEDGTGDHLKADHAMSARQVLSEWLPAGFALVDLLEFLPGQHLFILKVAGDTTVPGAPIINVDLLDAMERGLVEASAVGGGDASVTVRVRNLSRERLLVTMPAGMSFYGADGDSETRDMVSRRDAVIRLFDSEPREWAVRSVGRQRTRRPPGAEDRLSMATPASLPTLDPLMHQMFRGSTALSRRRSGSLRRMSPTRKSSRRWTTRGCRASTPWPSRSSIVIAPEWTSPAPRCGATTSRSSACCVTPALPPGIRSRRRAGCSGDARHGTAGVGAATRRASPVLAGPRPNFRR